MTASAFLREQMYNNRLVVFEFFSFINTCLIGIKFGVLFFDSVYLTSGCVNKVGPTCFFHGQFGSRPTHNSHNLLLLCH